MSFFFNDTATTEIYTLSLHDALPIFEDRLHALLVGDHVRRDVALVELHALGELEVHAEGLALLDVHDAVLRSEEHTSELQSRQYLVCRLLLEKKNIYLDSVSLAILIA